MNSTIIIVFLSILTGFLLFIVVYQQLGQQAGMRRSLREISGKLQEIMETGSDERVYVFTEEKELQELAAQLNGLLERHLKVKADYRRSEIAFKKMLSNISHDIKTPLTSIINYVDLLKKEGMDSPNASQYLEVLERQSARLKKLTEDLVEASKASSGAINVVKAPTNVQVLLEQTVGQFEERLEKNGIQVVLSPCESQSLILADGRLLWRVFDNLMNNICKYALSGTRVYLNMENTGDAICIVFYFISAYPLNISGEELMERFVRGDRSRNTEGSGLGLSIAKSLTELMQGSFELVVDGDLFKVLVSFPAMEESGAEKFPADN